MDETTDGASEVTDEELELVARGHILDFCSELGDSPNPKLGMEETFPRLGMEDTLPSLGMTESPSRLGMEGTFPRLGMDVVACGEVLTFSSMDPFLCGLSGVFEAWQWEADLA